MATYICETHNITIEVTGNTRKISMSMTPQNDCVIPITVDIQEGTFGNCVIKKISVEDGDEQSGTDWGKELGERTI